MRLIPIERTRLMQHIIRMYTTTNVKNGYALIKGKTLITKYKGLNISAVLNTKYIIEEILKEYGNMKIVRRSLCFGCCEDEDTEMGGWKIEKIGRLKSILYPNS